MLPSSVRRVVSTAPQSPASSSALIAALAAVSPRTATIALSARPSCHQRRCSSSKPSSPDKGAKDIPAGRQSSVPASSSATAVGESASPKTPGERRKRRPKESTATAIAKKLPSVPSTQHLSQEALGLATFFSLHRPISVTHSFPNTVTDEAFGAIFDPPETTSSRSNGRVGRKVSDAISTISRTIDHLEGPLAKMTLGGDAGVDEAGGPTRIEVQHPDGSGKSVVMHLTNLGSGPSGKFNATGPFLPFRPPPVPEPESSAAAETAEEDITAAEDAAAEPEHRVYKAVLTIEETTEADGQVKVVAHSPQLIEESGAEDELQLQLEQRDRDGHPHRPGRFLERMALRQLRYEDARQRQRLQQHMYRAEEAEAEAERDEGGMHAISVRRQKKLKMKKKKYKKLMRRTRNERRKLDRL